MGFNSGVFHSFNKNSNFFQRKVYRKGFFSKLYLPSPNFIFSRQFNVLNLPDLFCKWYNVKFILNCTIKNYFSRINKNRLKNIFLKVIGDSKVWLEVEKILPVIYSSLHNDYLLLEADIFNFSDLFFFLWDIFLFELDIFIIGFCLTYNSFRNILPINKSFLSSAFSLKGLVLNNYLPLKLERTLFLVNKLKYLKFQKDFRIFLKLKSNLYSGYVVSFVKQIFYTRYKTYLFFGLLSSKNFGDFFYQKLKSFV